MSSKLWTKAYKYQFDLNIEECSLALAFPCQIFILWKRGSHKIFTKQKYMLDNKLKVAKINEKLSMFTTIYYNDCNNQFLAKKSTVTVIIATDKGKKVGGVVQLNLAEFVSVQQSSLQKEKILKGSFNLLKCPDAQAKIQINIKSVFLNECQDGDTASMGSIGSQSTRKSYLQTESIFNDDLDDLNSSPLGQSKVANYCSQVDFTFSCNNTSQLQHCKSDEGILRDNLMKNQYFDNINAIPSKEQIEESIKTMRIRSANKPFSINQAFQDNNNKGIGKLMHSTLNSKTNQQQLCDIRAIQVKSENNKENIIPVKQDKITEECFATLTTTELVNQNNYDKILQLELEKNDLKNQLIGQNREIDLIKEQNQVLLKQLQKLENENQAYMKDKSDLLHQKDQREQEIKQFQIQIDALTKEREYEKQDKIKITDNFKQQLQTKETEFQQLQNSLEVKATEEKKNLQKKLETLQSELERCIQQNKQISAQLSQVCEDFKEKQSQSADQNKVLISQLEEKNQKYIECQNQIIQLTNDREACLQDKQKIKDEAEAAKNQFAQFKENYIKKINDLQAVTNQIGQTIKENEILKQNQEKLDRKCKQYDEMISTFKIKYKELESQRDNLVVHSEELEKSQILIKKKFEEDLLYQKQKYDNQMYNLTQAADKVQSQHEELIRNHEATLKELQQLKAINQNTDLKDKQDINLYKDQQIELKVKLQSVQNELKSRDLQLESVKRELVEQQKVITICRQQFEEQKQLKQLLEEKNQQLKIEKEKQSQKIVELENALRDQYEEHSSHDYSYKTLQFKYEELLKQQTEVQNKINATSSHSQLNEIEGRQIQEQVDELQKQNQQLSNEVQSLKDLIDALKSEAIILRAESSIKLTALEESQRELQTLKKDQSILKDQLNQKEALLERQDLQFKLQTKESSDQVSQIEMEYKKLEVELKIAKEEVSGLTQRVKKLDEKEIPRRDKKIDKLQRDNDQLQAEVLSLNMSMMKELNGILKKQEQIKKEYSRQIERSRLNLSQTSITDSERL